MSPRRDLCVLCLFQLFVLVSYTSSHWLHTHTHVTPIFGRLKCREKDVFGHWCVLLKSRDGCYGFPAGCHGKTCRTVRSSL